MSGFLKVGTLPTGRPMTGLQQEPTISTNGVSLPGAATEAGMTLLLWPKPLSQQLTCSGASLPRGTNRSHCAAK
jgi:hypothetical protein